MITKPSPRHGGEIRADSLYTLREAGRRLALGAAGMRAAQRAGLQTVPFGRTKYVLGADVLAFFRELSGKERHA